MVVDTGSCAEVVASETIGVDVVANGHAPLVSLMSSSAM